ncbi:hypothetical protein LX36DRAFT_296050 [Colletotrichum falcatum]|nr:hypothetical protein LX36DRAFT_296050 [Colletotrichum falcatum]
MTISMYDTLSRSGSANQFRQEVINTTPAEVCASPELQAEPEAELPFYLPFIVWARILLRTGIDCYSQLKDALGSSEQFSQEDFRRWLNIYLQKTSRFPEQETLSELATDPPEPTAKRRRIDPPNRRTSMCCTAAVPGQSGNPVQTGDSTACPLIGSHTDESVHEQAGVPISMRGSNVDDMTDTDAVRSGKGLSQTVTTEGAMLNNYFPDTFHPLSGTVPLASNSNRGFPDILDNHGVGQMAESFQLSPETAVHGPQPGNSDSLLAQPPAHIGNMSGPADWPQQGDIHSPGFLCPSFSSRINGFDITSLVPVYLEDHIVHIAYASEYR